MVAVCRFVAHTILRTGPHTFTGLGGAAGSNARMVGDEEWPRKAPGDAPQGAPIKAMESVALGRNGPSSAGSATRGRAPSLAAHTL